MTTETDLFFHYTNVTTKHFFKTWRDEQKLKVDFSEYPFVLVKMFNNCIREPESFSAVVTLHEDGLARLDLLQNTAYKTLEVRPSK